jgi:uncharacterized Tic20 family protein
VNETVTDSERNWAAIAHASTVLTVLVGLATGGAGSLLMALIPVGIYVAFRHKSRFVAFHALQAAVLQLTGLIVYALGLIILIIVTVVGWILTVLLVFVLVGFLLVPVALLVTLLLVLFAALFPLAVLGYALYGAVEAGRGADFRYWWIGDWLLEAEPSWLSGPRR